MAIEKPRNKDLKSIEKVLEQWTDPEEVKKYLIRVNSEIKGKTEYSMNFWIIKKEDLVVGIGGLAETLTIILPLAKTNRPGEIKILYISNKYRNKGFGKQMINFLENEAKNQNYKELFIRSAKRYKDTAYNFYKKMGYKNLCKLDNNMAVFYKLLK